jgi:hypothetical protein
VDLRRVRTTGREEKVAAVTCVDVVDDVVIASKLLNLVVLFEEVESRLEHHMQIK